MKKIGRKYITVSIVNKFISLFLSQEKDILQFDISMINAILL